MWAQRPEVEDSSPFFSSLLLESGLAIIMPQHAPLQEPILYPTTLRWLGLGPCLFWPTLSFFGESGLHSICQLFFPRTWRGIDWAKVDGRLQMGCDQKKTIRGGSASLSCPWKILNFVYDVLWILTRARFHGDTHNWHSYENIWNLSYSKLTPTLTYTYCMSHTMFWRIDPGLRTWGSDREWSGARWSHFLYLEPSR